MLDIPPSRRSQPLSRQEANLHALVERIRDAFKHTEGVPIVVGILQTADDGCCGSNLLRELTLAQPRLRAKVINLASDIGIDDFFLVLLGELRVVTDKTVIGVLQRGTGICVSPLPSFHSFGLNRFGFASNLPLRFTTRAISLAGTAFSFMSPCETTTGQASIKEVEHTIMNPLITRPKLIDAVPEVIRFGPPQFMPELLQAIQGQPFSNVCIFANISAMYGLIRPVEALKALG